MIIYPSGNGVIIEDGVRIGIDSVKRYEGTVHLVTHAHWDHLGSARTGPVFTNEETARILRVRGLVGKPVDSLEVGKYEIRWINAGHIVGSSQVLLLNGRSVLVTGDFKVEGDAIVSGAEMTDVDVLVMDTTFGVPYFRFPSRKILYNQLMRFVEGHLENGSSVVLFGYSVGKSQEITSLLNSRGIEPYVLPETHRVNALFGLRDRVLGSLPREPSVMILPPKFRRVLDAFSLQSGIPHRGIFVSGWNREMPLSSHADWFQTVKFVEKVSPEVVITYGENASRSARYLKEEGFNAIPLVNSLFL